jgi:DNA replication licensing factor MCM7
MLLLMVGGTTRNLQDGMKLRGDVHLCLMGDPGVAKSQLLKWVGGRAERGMEGPAGGAWGREDKREGLQPALLDTSLANL